MASRRLPLLRPSLLRPFLEAHRMASSVPSLGSPYTSRASRPSTPPLPPRRPFDDLFPFRRAFSVSSSEGSSSVLPIGSDHEFESTLKKVQEEELNALFYFTAKWCGPCKLIAPTISDESCNYGINAYKIDIDQEAIMSTLSKLQIEAVPTLHFFQNGKKVSEIVGVDIGKFKATTKSLYG